MIQYKLKLGAELATHLTNCDEMWLAVALISDKGYSFIQENINQEAKQHYLVGIGLPSSPAVLATLMQKENSETCTSRVYHRPGDFFHPKVYLSRRGDRLTAFVSSGNCTEGGLLKNREMSIKTDDENTCQDLLKWFTTLFKFGIPITQEFLDNYTIIFPSRIKRMEEDQADVTAVVDALAPVGILDGIDFTNQFFKKEHFDAFIGNKPTLQDDKTNEERMAVRRRLFDLHFLLYPLIEKKHWDLHEHYMFEDTVSSATHSAFTSDALAGIWLHYGRNKKAIKSFGDLTPIDFMRMQVILHRNTIGVWNRIGKDKGSKIDREYFRQQMMGSPAFRQRFYDIISSLPEDYFIRVRNETKYVTEFPDEPTLTRYVLIDHFDYYFIIGVEIGAGDSSVSHDGIASTVLKHFENLYPTYDLIKFNG